MIKRNRIVLITFLIEIILFWLIFFSGIILPVINLSVEEYMNSGTSFPRDAHQMIYWLILHIPSSLIIDRFFSEYEYVFLACVLQNCFIAYIIQRYINNKKTNKSS